MTPTTDMREPDGIDYIAESITEAFGERCPDFAEGCACCEAWKQYDQLRNLTVTHAGMIGALLRVADANSLHDQARDALRTALDLPLSAPPQTKGG